MTAGKLLHDFKCHEGQIQCIDFHPHEFLLATGVLKSFDIVLHCLFYQKGQSGIQNTGLIACCIMLAPVTLVVLLKMRSSMHAMFCVRFKFFGDLFPNAVYRRLR